MSSPNSCARCSQPAAVLTPGGLCPACAAADESTGRVPLTPFAPLLPRRPTPDPPADAPTATHDADRPTATGEPAPGELAHQPPPGYELVMRLGRGGMGTVYLARELVPDRLVAMKFLNHPGDPDSFERFLLELRVLADLNHPGVVRVFSSEFYRAQPYYTMEYLERGALSESLKGGAALPEADAVRLIRVVAGALAAAHAKGVIHRDLKPSNILIDSDGAPKVSDFGLAKRLERDESLTPASGALGTPSYMPPEQVTRRNGDIGPWSDVYGLGATLYHLLTGRPPFVGETSADTVIQLLSEPPPRPRLLRPEIPLGLEAVVMKCLEKETKDRYQSMAELLADLDRYEARQRTVAPPLTRQRRARQWLARNRRATVTATLMGVLMACSILLLWMQLSSRNQTTPDEQELMRGRLRAGHTVHVIEATGYPDWLKANWLIHPAPLSKSATAGDACSFESLHPSLLAFLKDPGVPSYRVTAVLRILRSGLVADPKQPPTLREFARSGVGLFLGHVAAKGSDGTDAHGFLVVDFNDYLHPDLRAAGITEAAVQPRGMMIVATPNAAIDNPAWGSYPTVRFPPAKTLPADWRVVQVEVRPTGVKFLWADNPEQRPKLIGEASAESIAGNYADFQDWLNRYRADAGITLPKWNTRAPIGVWSNSSAVAVKNVSIEPLP